MPVAFGHDALGRERRTNSANSVEAGGVRVDERAVDPAFGDHQVGQAVEQHQVALGRERQVLRGRHRGFGLARIDDDDLRVVRVAASRAPT